MFDQLADARITAAWTRRPLGRRRGGGGDGLGRPAATSSDDWRSTSLERLVVTASGTAQDLVALAQQGDREAFAELYVHYHSQIRAFLIGRVQHRETAEDLAQQVFLNAWRALPRYEERGAPFIAWLYQIARRAWIDHLRQARPTSELRLVDLAEEHDHDARLIVAEEFEEVERAMAALRGDHREVILLRFLMEHSTSEVAEKMCRSEGAVRVLQFRALQALRAELSAERAAAS